MRKQRRAPLFLIGLLSLLILVVLLGACGPVPTAAPGSGPGPTRIRAADSAEMVLVPGGEFAMGSADADPKAGADEKPQHTVYLDAFWINRTEVSNAQYAQFLNALGANTDTFRSDVMCLAYLDFPSAESLGADDHRHRLHLHWESWEFYVVLQGTRVLRIEQELAEVSAGEVLAVPPWVKHVLHGTETPFVGFTFRTPLLNDKVEF